MRPADIHPALRILKREVAKLPDAIVGRYSTDPFETLVSCILSLRTQDKTTEAASERLFGQARTPQEILGLSPSRLRRLIYPVCFYRNKTKAILAICRILINEYQGKVPDELEELLKLPGVGRKTANLVVTLAFRKPGICVDTHVHRITNRWGYVKTLTPEETEMALRKKLPHRYWIILNDLLVPYGQHLCRPLSPWCLRCTIRRFCARVGVVRSR